MKQFLLASSAMALIATASPAFAQEAEDEGAVGAEIIVTAQKRAENVQDVPVAVSVISGDALEQQGGINIENAQYLVPSLNFRKSGTALNQSLYLRGVGTTTFSIGGEPSVGTVLDGVVLARSGEAFSDLVDIERIEVLRGPQGTLFGKNASAGVINIVSKRPGPDFGGYAEGGFFFGNGEEYRVRGGVNLPLSEKLGSRITGFYSKWDGNIVNETLGRRVNGYERYGIRGVVEARPSDTVTLTLIGDWRKSNDDCCAEVIGAPARNADGTVYATFNTRAATGLPPLLGDRTRRVRQNLLTQALEKAWGISFQADVELNGPTITSITSYRGYDSNEIRDGDFLSTPYIGIVQSHDFGPQTGTTFTQELRLTSPTGGFFEYVAGLYYYQAEQERTFTRSNIACSASTLPAQGVLTPCSTTAGASTLTFPLGTATFGTTFKNMAGFGQATLNFSDNFRGIVGIRYTHDQLNGFHSRTNPVAGAANANFDQGVYNEYIRQINLGATPAAAQAAAVLASNGQPFRQKVTNNNWSGKAGLQYDISEDMMAYATYSRGYKGPGLNVFFNLNSNGTPPLAPETADSFEGGLKTTLLDGQMTLNIAGFYAKYKNFQANNPDFVLGQRVTRFTNAGTVSTRGFEIDMLYRPSDDFSLSGGVAYTDAKVDQFRLPPGAPITDQIPNGTQLPFSPKWKASLGSSYTIRTGGFADVELGAQGSYQSSQLALLVASPLIRQNGTIKDYGLLDLSIALVGKDDRFRVSFLAKNVFDTSFAAAISDGGPLSAGNTGSSSYRYIIPREADRYFGINARFNFGAN
ncbi:TonB-dependent receptor [Sphingorhabdus pulchriflava]|uniref:TonB-dependent receptor n=1 Tax=Sphingorhabdus pulchriflava TaxID=2292257 RepID=A0A371B1P7_9SPHN|nr:TonB-dependent receptor [Sphingorhabdus pulchriflava]RDV01447.1 TonB-dependent receptor [Sphingorhabdus pulchriflava]